MTSTTIISQSKEFVINQLSSLSNFDTAILYVKLNILPNVTLERAIYAVIFTIIIYFVLKVLGFLINISRSILSLVFLAVFVGGYSIDFNKVKDYAVSIFQLLGIFK